MIELRWNNGVLEQRTRLPRVDANGAFCSFTAWSVWYPVPTAPTPESETIEPIVGANIPEPFRSDL